MSDRFPNATVRSLVELPRYSADACSHTEGRTVIGHVQTSLLSNTNRSETSISHQGFRGLKGETGYVVASVINTFWRDKCLFAHILVEMAYEPSSEGRVCSSCQHVLPWSSSMLSHVSHQSISLPIACWRSPTVLLQSSHWLLPSFLDRTPSHCCRRPSEARCSHVPFRNPNITERHRLL